jgi:signal peptide peptidase SppA
MSSRKVALGIMTFSLLALLVGIFNAARLGQEDVKSKQAGGAGSGVSSLLNKRSHLALIDISGMISMEAGNDNGFFHNESNAMQARKALDSAAKDDSIKGVLLRINSPGGTVGMSQELNAAVQRVSKKKPLVVSMGDLTASGGYYTACAADKILANPGTLTASIGVIISTLDFTDLMQQKLGVRPLTIKSGKFKDVLSPYRHATPEEVALIQKLINESYQDFLATVVKGRTRFMTDEAKKKALIAKITAIADGRVVTGRQALEAGLVDELGDQESAYTILDGMAKERFHLKGKERLPLESEDKNFSIMQFLGISPESMMPSVPGAVSAVQASKMLPLSMRYPNQPLWVME